MRFKKIICLSVVFVILLGLMAGCGNKETNISVSNESEQSETNEYTELDEETKLEIQSAVELGLVPENLQTDYYKQIQYNEFIPMMTNVISLRYGEGEYLDEWLEVSAIAEERDTPMTRGEGAGVIFAAAVTVGMDDYHSKAAAQRDLDGETQGAAIEYIPDMSDMFPFMAEPYYNRNWGEELENHFLGAERYPWHRYSPVSGKTLMDIDTETPSMRYRDAFSRAEAICAALRCYESWVAREYIDLTDTKAVVYDASIITEELLNKESALPEVSHNNLPSDWQGQFIYTNKAGTNCAWADFYKERDIRFLAENDMNIARVSLGFSTLQYPNYPENGQQINLSELKELDQMIACAMKYDVHITLGMMGLPGYGNSEDDNYQAIGDHNWPDAEHRQLIHDYWVMLANRYKDIPSKNLTFELCAEWSVSDAQKVNDFNNLWSSTVRDIRNISPERVLIASFDIYDANKHELADTMANLGVSLAVHPYFPSEFAFYGREDHIYGIGEYLTWPMPYFPTADFDNGNVPITISGNIGGTTLSIYAIEGHVWSTETGDPVLTVAADGK